MTQKPKKTRISAEERRHEFAKIETAQQLAARIAIARGLIGWSQTQLAEQVGVTRGAVGQWESGATEPAAANLREISIKTGIDYDWLATGRGQPPFRDGLLPAGMALRVELTIRLPEKATLSEIAEKVAQLKKVAEQQGTVTGRVTIGVQHFDL